MALTRSQNMARIRAKDTSPELILRKLLWKAGVRYRLHYKTPGGRADIAIPARKIAIFIDGCFWHGCPEHYVRPRSRNEFWDGKLAENVARDRRQTTAAKAAGWKCVRIWEHELREHPAGVARLVLARSVADRSGYRVARVRFLAADGMEESREIVELESGTIVRIDEGRRSTRKQGRVHRTQKQPLAATPAPREGRKRRKD